MEQLIRRSDGSLWSCGCSSFFVSHTVNRWRLPIAVQCRIGSLESTDLALLDTGAEWSVIGGDLVEILKDELNSPTDSFSISTRMGTIRGALHRIQISLLAEQNCGKDLTVESSVLISQDWKGPVVLGYRGFLERIRFALDPGVSPDEQRFYFGTVE